MGETRGKVNIKKDQPQYFCLRQKYWGWFYVVFPGHGFHPWLLMFCPFRANRTIAKTNISEKEAKKKAHKLRHNFRGIMIASLKIYRFYMR